MITLWLNSWVRVASEKFTWLSPIILNTLLSNLFNIPRKSWILYKIKPNFTHLSTITTSIKLHESFPCENGTCLAIVLEYCLDGDLRKLIGMIKQEDCPAILKQIAEGLVYLPTKRWFTETSSLKISSWRVEWLKSLTLAVRRSWCREEQKLTHWLSFTWHLKFSMREIMTVRLTCGLLELWV